jgi:signal transduction histidine kinase
VVRDTGPGIPPDLRERVWERGVSASGGQGLGLALVRDVVTAHGGSATLLDESGAAIELRLPLAPAALKH